MSDKNSPWANLAARVIRVVLARKDIGYSELADRLATIQVTEDDKALATRVSLGRVRLAMLLQILHVTNAEVPLLWRDAIKMKDSWEKRASAVIACEMSQNPMTNMDELATKLVMLGAGFTEKTLISHIESGTLSLPLFLRCLVILRSSSLDRFIDYSDLRATAKETLEE